MVNCRDIAHKLCCTCSLRPQHSKRKSSVYVLCAYTEIKTGWINFRNVKGDKDWPECLFENQTKTVTFANWIHLSKFTTGVKKYTHISLYMCTLYL